MKTDWTWSCRTNSAKKSFFPVTFSSDEIPPSSTLQLSSLPLSHSRVPLIALTRTRNISSRQTSQWSCWCMWVLSGHNRSIPGCGSESRFHEEPAGAYPLAFSWLQPSLIRFIWDTHTLRNALSFCLLAYQTIEPLVPLYYFPLEKKTQFNPWITPGAQYSSYHNNNNATFHSKFTRHCDFSWPTILTRNKSAALRLQL